MNILPNALHPVCNQIEIKSNDCYSCLQLVMESNDFFLFYFFISDQIQSPHKILQQLRNVSSPRVLFMSLYFIHAFVEVHVSWLTSNCINRVILFYLILSFKLKQTMTKQKIV